MTEPTQPPPESARCQWHSSGACSRCGRAMGRGENGVRECNEPAPVATDTQARECECAVAICSTRSGHANSCPLATPAPAVDAEVSHEQARSWLDRMGNAWQPSAREKLLAYISQQEARQQQTDWVEHLLEVERLEHEETKGYRQHAEQAVTELREVHRVEKRDHQNTFDKMRRIQENVDGMNAHIQNSDRELQQLYAAFSGSGHSPKNPREAAQAIGQMAEAEREVAELREKERRSRDVLRSLANSRDGYRDKKRELDQRVASLLDNADQLRTTLQGKDEAIVELQVKLDVLKMQMATAVNDVAYSVAQRDELSRKLEAAERKLGKLRDAAKRLVYKTPLHNGLPDTADLNAADLDELHNLLSAATPDQAPPAKPLTPDDVPDGDVRMQQALGAFLSGEKLWKEGNTHAALGRLSTAFAALLSDYRSTQARAKAIARAVVAEVAERAAKGPYAGFSKLAEAAKEENRG